MDTKDMQGHSECGNCGGCGHGMGGVHGHCHWKHILIKILVALFIFWLGVQVGELKGMLRAGYSNYGSGYGMMGSFGRTDGNYYGWPAMMGGWFSQSTTTAR